MSVFAMNILFVFLNGGVSILNYNIGNHKTSLFSMFVVGWCAALAFKAIL